MSSPSGTRPRSSSSRPSTSSSPRSMFVPKASKKSGHNKVAEASNTLRGSQTSPALMATSTLMSRPTMLTTTNSTMMATSTSTSTSPTMLMTPRRLTPTLSLGTRPTASYYTLSSPVAPSTGELRSGHIEVDTLYGMGTPAVDPRNMVVNSMNAPNNSTLQCGCENIDCPFCNLMLSVQMKEASY